jgi:dTDP-4-amino-4,6-dideoxygalactose transaminase
MEKLSIEKLAIFGGKPAFEIPRSTSNLIQPNKDKFLSYMTEKYDKGLKLGGLDVLTDLFEKRFADFHSVKHCVAVCNGLWGLVMCIACLRKEGKNEIIMPSLTYRRMADIAAWLKMTPHFCDVDIKTLGMTSEIAEKCINENTALILAPHPIVNLCDLDGLSELSLKYEMPLLIDGVEASYAEHKGRRIGSFGDAECFSMHASKFLNGFEGGYITTNNDSLAKRLRNMRNYGIDENGELQELGLNGQLSEIHVAMTLASLDELDEQVARNQDRFLKYKELLEGISGVELVEYSMLEKRSFKNILIKLNEKWTLSRELTLKILQAENMVVRPYYYPPLHKKDNQFKTIVSDLKNTTYLMEKYMLLPCGEFVSLEDIEVVVEYLKFLENNSEAVIKRLS